MTESTNLADEYKDTSCYTYEVTMLVQILAPNKDIADQKLDKEGGYISKRSVSFKYSTVLHKDEDEDVLNSLDESWNSSQKEDN